MSVEDVLFVIRKDRKKYARAKELLKKNEEVKWARSNQFDEKKTILEAKRIAKENLTADKQ